MQRSLFLIAWLSVPAFLGASDTPAFRWQRDVELPEVAAATLVGVSLDSHFFKSTRDEWPDVRLRNDRNESIAFVIPPVHDLDTKTVREFWSAEQSSARVDATHGLQVDLVLRDKEPVPHGLRIITPLRDFEHQVRVESSADGESWTPAGSPTLIFDYSRFVDACNVLVPLKSNESRRFRLTIEHVTAQQESLLKELHQRLRGGDEISRTESTTIVRRPFRIDQIEFYRDISRVENRRPKTSTYPVTNFGVKEIEKADQTIVTFDSQREPLTAVVVNVEGENFSREANVEIENEDPNGTKSWTAITNGTLTRLSVGTIQLDERTLNFPETRSHHYRVVIENRDSPPLVVSGVEVSGPLYQLVFLASKDQKLTAEYGSSNAMSGRYDEAALQAALSAGQSPEIANWQSPRENQNAPPDQGRSWKPWNDSRVLVGTIVAFTLLLGWGLFQAVRRIEVPSDE